MASNRSTVCWGVRPSDLRWLYSSSEIATYLTFVERGGSLLIAARPSVLRPADPKAVNRLEEAFWQYLWVDQEYNQDPEEHSKALYYLAILFDRVKRRPDRAKTCLDRLLKDKLFAGLEYQKQAAKESQKSGAEK